MKLDWINHMFTGAKVKSSKKSYVPRGQGAKHAELNGTPEGQIRRTGRWNNNALTSYYLTYLLYKFVRGMAGFSPSIKGNFYLPRAKELPPRSLEQAIWPFIDKWLIWFDSHTNIGNNEDIEDSREEEEDDGVDDRQDLAAQGFLRLLQQL